MNAPSADPGTTGPGRPCTRLPRDRRSRPRNPGVAGSTKPGVAVPPAQPAHVPPAQPAHVPLAQPAHLSRGEARAHVPGRRPSTVTGSPSHSRELH
jgi:hypothetical protein